MKFVPFTVEVPEHYADFMREVESVAPGEWARWAMHIIDQSLAGEEHGESGAESLIIFTINLRTFESRADKAQARKTIRAAWKAFVRAEVRASVAAK